MKNSSKLAAAIPQPDRKWQIEDDLRTLQSAEVIKRDPARMKAVRALAKERLGELKKLAGEA